MIGDPLGMLAQLSDAPFGGVALGHVVRWGVADQALAQRIWQHEIAHANGEVAVAGRVQPEFHAAGCADGGVEMMKVGQAPVRRCWRGKNPALDLLLRSTGKNFL